MKDLEKAKKLVLKFSILFYFDIFTIQPDFLTRNIATALYFLIVGYFLQLLCIE